MLTWNYWFKIVANSKRSEYLLLKILIWIKPVSISLTILKIGVFSLRSSCLETIIDFLQYESAQMRKMILMAPGIR